MQPVRIGILAFILAAALSVAGQLPDGSILQKRVSLKIQDRSIASILDLISEQAGVYFSYDASLVDSEKQVSLKAINKTINEVLSEILGTNDFVFKELNNHIIITFRETTVAVETDGPSDSVKTQPLLFSGKVIDKKTREPVQFASVSLFKKPIGTITNQDGEYTLKINPANRLDTIAFSCVGYAGKLIKPADLNNNALVELESISIKIKEVRVKAISPDEILKKIIENLPLNYPDESIMMTSFYRETVRQDDEYINVSEAVMEILKASYMKEGRDDKVRIIKGRKSPDVSRFRWINFKLQGGPYTITFLDVVKTLETFLNPEYREYYKYDIREVIWYKTHPAFVLQFKPLRNIGFPCFNGEMIVDRETYAIMNVKFSFGRPALSLAGKSMIRKKPRGVNVRPVAVEYMVDYALFSEKWYLSRASSLIEFKIRSREDRINSVYTSLSEMLVTDFKKTSLRRFPKEEEFTYRDIFSDAIVNYDEEFWENYNTIKPNEDLRKAIKNFKFDPAQSADSISVNSGSYLSKTSQIP